MAITNSGAYGLNTGGISWTGDTIKARLFLTSDTPDIDATSMTGIGVTGNDVVLGSKTVTKDTLNDRIVFDCADFTFAAQAAGAECDHVAIFKFDTNDASSTPIAFVPIQAITPGGFDITINVSASGLFYLQQA